MKNEVHILPEFEKPNNVINNVIYEGHALKPNCSVEIEASLVLKAVEISLTISNPDFNGAVACTVFHFPESIDQALFANIVLPIAWLFRPEYDPRKAVREYVESFVSQGRVEITETEGEANGATVHFITLVHALYKGRIAFPNEELEKYFELKADKPLASTF